MERLKSNITCIELPCKHNLCKRHLHTSCKANKFKPNDKYTKGGENQSLLNDDEISLKQK